MTTPSKIIPRWEWRTFAPRLGTAEGRFAALGTLDELRLQTASEGSSLEEMFLKLTGAAPANSLDAVLDR